ncbi:peptidase M15 [Oleidesulfovibrio sp.]|uniref:peptidase M15 n=1 Tax=Oleidesulfovibrio sp. TaxID=2909707 RepID=UPI003A8C3618
MSCYTPKHFQIEELVPPQMLHNATAAPRKLFMLFDIHALQALDALRRRYGPTTVNTGHLGGDRSLSGWRPFDCSTGAPLSQHKFGRAFDCLFRDATPQEVRCDLMARPDDEEFARIRRIEAFEGMSWFHFDTGNHARETCGIAVVGGKAK